MPRLITFIFLLLLGFNPEHRAYENNYLLKVLDQSGQSHEAELSAISANRIKFAWNQKQMFKPVQPPVWRYRVTLSNSKAPDNPELFFNYDGISLVTPVARTASSTQSTEIFRISGTNALNQLLNKTIGKQE